MVVGGMYDTPENFPDASIRQANLSVGKVKPPFVHSKPPCCHADLQATQSVTPLAHADMRGGQT
jgi:hypothetical protein